MGKSINYFNIIALQSFIKTLNYYLGLYRESVSLHCDFKSWKMITSVYGRFLLVLVNMKKKSKNYLKHKKLIIDYKKPTLILIPPYYANGHLCLSDECIFHYKWSYKGKYVDASNQESFMWNDPKINVKWPVKKPILSNRDKKAKTI